MHVTQPMTQPMTRPSTQPSNRPRAIALRRPRPLASAVAGLVAGGLLVGVAHAGPAVRAAAPEPAPDTVVRVTGDAQNGFGILHYDGTSEFTARQGVAIDECNTFPAKIGRARCRVHVKTRYAELAALKQALKWAKGEAS